MPIVTESTDPRLVARFAARLSLIADHASHRRLLMLAGEHGWGLAAAAAITRDRPAESVFWVGRDAPAGITPMRGEEVLRLLGTESGLLVMDAWSGFDADAFGAGAGTVCAGGLVVLVTPPLMAWPAYVDPQRCRISVDGTDPSELSGRFIRRLTGVLDTDPDAVVVEQGTALPAINPGRPAATRAPLPDDCLTADQAEAVEAVVRVVTGHRRRPLVLTADRGRGKSAALGLAVARLTQRRSLEVVLTAPDERAVEAVVRHAGTSAQLRYVPPRRLLEEQPRAGLLLVDEAAGIPVPMLAELLRSYKRVVFSSTVHGYEGTGRGFSLRFREHLDTLTPGWRALHLTTPIRWAENDPVERFTFQALLLDAEPAIVAEPSAITPRPVVHRIGQDALLDREDWLRQLFGLLVQAHYRTRPLDLRNLLEGPRLAVHAAMIDDAVVGAALVADEGGFGPRSADAIWTGRRRPHGHLLPQSLAAHVGVRTAPLLRCARVMRIAVHPQLRGRGIGRALIDHAVTGAAADGMSVIGTSFGATPALLAFWRACGLHSVRVGSRRDSASGTQSVLMIRPLDTVADAVVKEALMRHAESFPVQLLEPLAKLDVAVARALLAERQPSPPTTDKWLEVAAFALGRREYAVCLHALRPVALWGLSGGTGNGGLPDEESELLVQRVLQGRPWHEVARTRGLAGRAAIIRSLRQAFVRLLRQGAPAAVLEDSAVRSDQNNTGSCD